MSRRHREATVESGGLGLGITGEGAAEDAALWHLLTLDPAMNVMCICCIAAQRTRLTRHVLKLNGIGSYRRE